MELNQILSSLLAGGLAGQVVSLIANHRLQRRRDLNLWIRNEKYKNFSFFISLVSATNRDDYNTFPDEIRVASQKIHILYIDGVAPKNIEILMEKLFQYFLQRKLGRVNNLKKWRGEVRENVKLLRIEFSKELRKNFT
ncbi:hypothetical protein [Haliovirga abyssi]|uniref:Uncharacterized protein n=1 Tax=Haliovirga abyssi TaxID=2996794 RepID=A0AAU9D8L3_9FUSO|nr:hypothetical protein [Haliovirga abyssi]BDU50943.1 hypothetical protein HLVA_15120 [Haliovirga abyssi]